MMKKDANFEFGALVGAAMADVSAGELRAMRASDAVMSSADAAPFNRELCKIAAAAFALDGAATSAPAILFRNLAAQETWHDSYNRFTDCVKRAMAKSAMLPLVAATHDKMGGGVLKTLIALGALGGAGAGSLAFMLNRNANQTSADNAALLEKVRAYKQLRREIEEDMSANEVMRA